MLLELEFHFKVHNLQYLKKQKMKKTLLLLVALLSSSYFSFSQSFTEGTDMANTGPGIAYTVAGPNIVIGGILTTPADGQDHFQVIVPAGCSITGVDYTMTDPVPVTVNGHFHFNSNNDETYSGPVTGSFQYATQFPNTSFPVGPGTYDCFVVANIASNCAWTMTFQTTCTACTEPDVPTVTADASICLGDSINLEILSGNLNDATDWEWYSGSCGGTSEASGTSMMVTPTSTTTYYARGEGGCTTPATCESVTITVNTVEIGVNVSTWDLAAVASGATYQWLNCDNAMAPILSDTNQTLGPHAPGNYAVIVTENGCVDTSLCQSVGSIGLNEEAALGTVNIYPSPAQDYVIIKFESEANQLIELRIVNLLGEVVYENETVQSKGSLKIDCAHLVTGIYIVELTTTAGELSKKLIIE